MKARAAKSKEGKSVLTAVAESLGLTLGVIAAKANAAQEALTENPIAVSVRRSAHTLVRYGKRSLRRAKRSMPAKHSGQGSRRSASSAKRTVGRGKGSPRAESRKA
jgi:hypothetical protein